MRKGGTNLIAYVCRNENDKLLDKIVENENRSLNKIEVENIAHFVKRNSSKLEHFKQVFFNLSSVDSTPDKILEAIEMILIFNSNLIVLAFEENRKSLLLDMLSKYDKVIILYDYKEEDIRDILKEQYIKQETEQLDIIVDELQEDEEIEETAKPKKKKQFFISKKKIVKNQAIENEKHDKIKNPVVDNERILDRVRKSEDLEGKKVLETQGLHETKLETKHEDKQETVHTVFKEKFIIRPKEKVKIAICGTQSRIGTTTQSLLITQYLRQQGMYTCYVEACKHKQIETISSVYTVVENTETGLISLPGLDIYHKQNLAYLMGLNIDFYVFDYGLFSDIELETFLLSDIKIIVMGVKPWEMEQTAEVLKALKESIDCHFIASFVDSSEQESIKFMMMDYAERTYFSSYTPNMFSLQNENSDIYADIFKGYKQELGNENLLVQKKQGFLGRWFGK